MIPRDALAEQRVNVNYDSNDGMVIEINTAETLEAYTGQQRDSLQPEQKDEESNCLR